MKYSKEYKTTFGILSYSSPFFIKGEIKPITTKFNKSSFGVKINDNKILEFLKKEGVKLYGENVYIELKNKNDFKTPLR